MTESEMDGVEILRLANLPRITTYDDLADEYSIRLNPEAASGLVVYGRFGNRWEANPGLRPVVRALLEQLGMLKRTVFSVMARESATSLWRLMSVRNTRVEAEETIKAHQAIDKETGEQWEYCLMEEQK